jgi:hypothetical protein
MALRRLGDTDVAPASCPGIRIARRRGRHDSDRLGKRRFGGGKPAFGKREAAERVQRSRAVLGSRTWVERRIERAPNQSMRLAHVPTFVADDCLAA